MTDFEPVASISLEEVNALWTTDLDGTTIDPTGVSTSTSPLVVQFAFPVSSGNQLAPAQPSTWYTGSWLINGTGKGYVAQCLIGPGGALTLTPGQQYDVWSKVTGSPEQPVKFAGTLPVY
jgi:hypothetical protein